MSHDRRGAAIIEVLVALVVLGVAGSGLVALLGQTHTTVRATHDRERALDAPSAILDGAVSWSHADLDARIGATRMGGHVLAVRRIAPSLYALDLLDSANVLVLRTVLYRPDSVAP